MILNKNASFIAKYRFISDRCRAMAMDINLQGMRDELAVETNERNALFLIIARHRLCEIDIKRKDFLR